MIKTKREKDFYERKHLYKKAGYGAGHIHIDSFS